MLSIVSLNPLVLAFAGDAYWTLVVRRRLVDSAPAKVGELHKQCSTMVSAAAQSGYYKKMAPHLTETEADVAKRARNAHNNTVPKNARLADYKAATAFEAVLGYNLLTDNGTRLKELTDLILQ
jgi:ribonuclease-3 family protein